MMKAIIESILLDAKDTAMKVAGLVAQLLRTRSKVYTPATPRRTNTRTSLSVLQMYINNSFLFKLHKIQNKHKLFAEM